MRSNRGSAAVISVVFMMFLLIIGIGFMPLMSSEVRHASMDMDEQKAWYAAEAGIKYAKAYQTDASAIKTIIGTNINLADDSNTAGYKLTMKDKTDGSAVTSSTSGFPVADKTYIVYSEGIYNGVKKVMTGEFVFATSSSSGGESGGGTSGGNASVLPGLIHASSISISGGNLTGDLYAVSMSGNNYATYNFHTQSSGYSNSLFTHIQESWFPTLQQVVANQYTKLLSEYGNEPKTKIKNNSNYYINASSIVDWKGNSYGSSGSSISTINGASGAVLYVYDDLNLYNIYGSSGGEPFTVVFVNDQETIKNVNVYGNVRILAKNSLKLSGGGQNSGKIMILTNGNLTLTGWNVVKGFISSNASIVISGGGFVGQIMAKDSVTISNQDTVYNNEVLSDKKFWLPEWLE